MDFQREEELRRIAEAAREQERAAYREIAVGQADEKWDAGDRSGAMVRLANQGFDDVALVRYCRAKGLTEDEARQIIRSAPFDRS